jgi:hypothetical protein
MFARTEDAVTPSDPQEVALGTRPFWFSSFSFGFPSFSSPLPLPDHVHGVVLRDVGLCSVSQRVRPLQPHARKCPNPFWSLVSVRNKIISVLCERANASRTSANAKMAGADQGRPRRPTGPLFGTSSVRGVCLAGAMRRSSAARHIASTAATAPSRQ